MSPGSDFDLGSMSGTNVPTSLFETEMQRRSGVWNGVCVCKVLGFLLGLALASLQVFAVLHWVAFLLVLRHPVLALARMIWRVFVDPVADVLGAGGENDFEGLRGTSPCAEVAGAGGDAGVREPEFAGLCGAPGASGGASPRAGARGDELDGSRSILGGGWVAHATASESERIIGLREVSESDFPSLVSRCTNSYDSLLGVVITCTCTRALRCCCYCFSFLLSFFILCPCLLLLVHMRLAYPCTMHVIQVAMVPGAGKGSKVIFPVRPKILRPVTEVEARVNFRPDVSSFVRKNKRTVCAGRLKREQPLSIFQAREWERRVRVSEWPKQACGDSKTQECQLESKLAARTSHLRSDRGGFCAR